MYLYQPISNILSRTDYDYIPITRFSPIFPRKEKKKKEEKLNVKGKAKVGLHGDQPTNQLAKSLPTYIHHPRARTSLVRAGARALLPTSSPFFSVRRRFVSTHSTRRTVGAGVCDQCVALAPVVMVTVRATHSETNDPPRSCVSACSRSPVRSRSRSTTVRGACLALPRVCVRVCACARARRAGGERRPRRCELLRFANRMISFFFPPLGICRKRVQRERRWMREIGIFFFLGGGSIPLLIVCYSV